MEMRETPFGSVLMPGTVEENDRKQKILYARHKFVTDECSRRGWPKDFNKLSIDQVMEIREMEDWKNPKI